MSLSSPQSPTAESKDDTPLTSVDERDPVQSMLTRIMARQDAQIAQLQAGQDRLMAMLAAGQRSGSSEVLDGEQEQKQRERYIVANSRQSVYFNNSTHGGVGDSGSSPLSPFAPPFRPAQTQTEQERRASHGESFRTPAPVASSRPRAAAAAADEVMGAPGGAAINKGKDSPYEKANHAISRMDKWYGDKKNDKGIDVWQFVRSIDFHLTRYMGDQQFGRLELVIAGTGGPAQTWLMDKRDDLDFLVRSGSIRPEAAEWDAVRAEFIRCMGGGQSQRLYEAKLDELKLGKADGSEEVSKFITHFREYAMRAYPLDKHPDTASRSIMLGKVFKERLEKSDIEVWAEAMRCKPLPETLEQWEDALSTAWSTVHTIRERMRKAQQYSTQRGGTASVHNMLTEYETGNGAGVEGQTSSGESLNAMGGKRAYQPGKSEGKKTTKNKHIDGKMARQLMQMGRCLHCYQGGHFAKECPAPANRPPKDEELNGKAGQ